MTKEVDSSQVNFSTEVSHAGRTNKEPSVPIYMGARTCYGYTRGNNPTIRELEENLMAIEKAAFATAASSGMAAISQTLLSLLKQGDRVVCHRSVYDWTDWLLRDELPRFGIHAVQVDFRDGAALEEALDIPTQVVYLEPLSNPGIDLIDVRAVIKQAHAAGALVVVDNTFLSPALLRPLEYDADVVLHSATKYLSGHGDALGGIVLTNSSYIDELLRYRRNLHGGVISPFNAFLILRGVNTLACRMRQHSDNAQAVACFLAEHPAVAEVRYPGLRNDPGHTLAKELLPHGSGGMLGFVIKGGQPAVNGFKAKLKLCKPGVSLGDVETLVYCRKREERKGIPEGFVRLSVGLEDSQDIIADLSQALDNVKE